MRYVGQNGRPTRQYYVAEDVEPVIKPTEPRANASKDTTYCPDEQEALRAAIAFAHDNRRQGGSDVALWDVAERYAAERVNVSSDGRGSIELDSALMGVRIIWKVYGEPHVLLQYGGGPRNLFYWRGPVTNPVLDRDRPGSAVRPPIDDLRERTVAVKAVYKAVLQLAEENEQGGV